MLTRTQHYSLLLACLGALSLLTTLPGFLIILLTFLVSLALFLGPFRPVTVAVSPTYVPPPSDAVHDQS